ncbi:amidohydrolase family protein [Amycolatopsis jiangsuensis]|uniref:Putative TIM-barrel fold metal-dependent hydrolase n=1 Tax=Amycolatopsis jiangsuensis TaxID=1181879 RepID=A0A840J666_9PSEU|nr:amidohydrolase family protein [Amycolatopsis jiangsuensis]MBB4689273.1 putative TIM-barrel fold metal-dependent hydrolase [Amycolatopsis jiangsuensis]
MAEYGVFDPDTHAPKWRLPAGACDSQTHIFGDRDRFPVKPDTAYVAYDATVQTMLRTHKVLGIERGVIVQPTAYGTDHSALIEALSVAGSGYVGCGRVDDSVDDDQLAEMDAAGIRGARFNFHPKLTASRLAPDEIRRTIERVARLGWYFKLQLVDMDPDEVTSLFDGVDAQIIVDHMGPLDYDRGLADPRFRKMLELLDRGNWWMLLSNGDKRAEAAGHPWDDAVAYAREYIRRAPERMLWASDWPHPIRPVPVPNDGALLDLFARYAPDEATRRQVLVTNPQRIFGFA